MVVVVEDSSVLSYRPERLTRSEAPVVTAISSQSPQACGDDDDDGDED